MITVMLKQKQNPDQLLLLPKELLPIETIEVINPIVNENVAQQNIQNRYVPGTGNLEVIEPKLGINNNFNLPFT